MKFIIAIVLVLCSFGCGFVGVLAAGDPEGRGGSIAMRLFVAAIVCVVVAVCVLVYWSART